jgi:hypothetical protein
LARLGSSYRHRHRFCTWRAGPGRLAGAELAQGLPHLACHHRRSRRDPHHRHFLRFRSVHCGACGGGGAGGHALLAQPARGDTASALCPARRSAVDRNAALRHPRNACRCGAGHDDSHRQRGRGPALAAARHGARAVSLGGLSGAADLRLRQCRRVDRCRRANVAAVAARTRDRRRSLPRQANRNFVCGVSDQESGHRGASRRHRFGARSTASRFSAASASP